MPTQVDPAAGGAIPASARRFDLDEWAPGSATHNDPMIASIPDHGGAAGDLTTDALPIGPALAVEGACDRRTITAPAGNNMNRSVPVAVFGNTWHACNLATPGGMEVVRYVPLRSIPVLREHLPMGAARQ